MVANPKNDAHIIAIVTGGGQTLGKNIVNIDEDSNERESNEQANEKRKRLEKSNDDVPNLAKLIIEKPEIVEKKIESEEAPQAVDCITPKLEETLIVSIPQIKIPLLFP